MLLHNDNIYIAQNFDSEDELERVIAENYEHVFGPDSIYLPKALIHTSDGSGTIPDGFAVDIANRRWYVVEAELASHSVWNHIAPQIAKQTIAAAQPATRALLAETIVGRVKDESEILEKFFDYDIEEIDIRHFLDEIFSEPPIIAIPIDEISKTLEEWAQTQKYEVRLWTVRKLVDYHDQSNIIYEIPDEYTPDYETTVENETDRTHTVYDVSVSDLINSGILSPGDSLVMPYRPRNGSPTEYTATVQSDGSLTVLDRTFKSVSYAALYGIQDAGSTRTTVNGWTSWKTQSGQTLADLREKYLSSIPDIENESG